MEILTKILTSRKVVSESSYFISIYDVYHIMYLAEMNGVPTFGLNGELHSENDDVLEDWDVLVPEDNIHVHSSRENEDESTMVEPLNYLDLGGSGDVLDYMDYNEANDFNYPNSIDSMDYNDDED